MMLLQNKVIFVVEDNLQNRLVFNMALTRHGARVDFERWGRESIGKLKKLSHLDLIILDLMLPLGISGFDLCEQIRAIPSLMEVPVVAVSAMDPAIAIPKVRAKGFSSFIAKPIDSDLFPSQVASIIEGAAVWDAGGALKNP